MWGNCWFLLSCNSNTDTQRCFRISRFLVLDHQLPSTLRLYIKRRIRVNLLGHIWSRSEFNKICFNTLYKLTTFKKKKSCISTILYLSLQSMIPSINELMSKAPGLQCLTRMLVTQGWTAPAAAVPGGCCLAGPRCTVFPGTPLTDSIPPLETHR